MATQDIHQQPDEARAQVFGYTCGACSRCCQHKIIQVNPYEVARLARRLNISTTEFRAHWTDGGTGIHLRRTEDNDTCVFLGPQGCTVHSDRPLVCRLYPLGRNETAGGAEKWIELTPHPQSAGEYHGRGTIADYLKTQGAEPFLVAADQYVQWVRDATQSLASTGNTLTGTDVADMDAAIAAHCAANRIPEPGDMEERRQLHLEILYQALQPKEGNDGKNQ